MFPAMPALVGFPCETAVSIASLMVGGMPMRHPRLRIAFSHGGGVFGLVLPRPMHGWNSMKELREKVQSPAEQARKLYHDTLV
jgi:aminocarboxymuconate-semialdehyde decarboxylase